MIPFMILAIENEEDKAFMTEIYTQYERLMWSEIRKVVKNNPCEIEDIFQTLLVKLIQKVDRLRSMESRSMVNYIITAAQNTSIDALRKLQKPGTYSINDEEWFGRDALRTDDDVEDFVYRRDDVVKLKAIWPFLDDRSRNLLEKKYFMGMSTREMGAELGIKHDSVRVELSRARKKAKVLLEEKFSMTGLST